MNRIVTAAAAFALTAIAGTAAAAEYSVCASGCDFATVQGAVDGSAAWDVLFLEDEVFAESVYVSGPRVIYAEPGAELRGDGAGPVLTVGPAGDLDIEGLAITDGGGDAGIINLGSLVLSACDVRGHDTLYGGILNAGAMQIVGASVVRANQGQYLGGGISNFGHLLVGNSTVTANQGYLGGGIANSNGTLIVTASSLSLNHATSLGGAWSNHNLGGTVTFAGSSSTSQNTTGSGSYTVCYDVNNPAACTP